MGSRRVVGVLAVMAGVAMVLGSLVAPPPVAATSGYVLPLNNQSAPAGTDCPDSLNDYWHFIIAPNSGGYAFLSITINVAGTSYTFTGGQIIPNGTQTDNVFVAVPAGKTLGQLVQSGSSATISGASTPADNVKFVLSHLCDGTATTTTTTTTTTIAPTTTSSTTTTSTTTTSTTSTTTTTTVVEEIELTPVPYCKEVDVAGKTIKEWYDVANNTGDTVAVEWADGDEEIDDEDTARISTAGPGIELTVGDEVVGSSQATLDTCTTTVEFTKSVLGQPLSDTYMIRVSRLVAPDYVMETEFDIAGGETVEVDLPSTGDESGFTYKIEESVDGGASMHTVTPNSITLSGHLGETVSVVITNSYASISLDKQVSATVVAPGDSVDYTLIAENTGALVLEDVVISDLLPVDVTLASWSIVDDAGICALTVATQPQTVTCELDDPLPVDGFTKAITLTVTVDQDITTDTILLNQAKVAGFFIRLSEARTEGLNTLRAQAEDTADLSCIPVPAGAVCDLSAKVGSTVLVPVVTTTTEAAVQGPVTTTTTPPTTVGKTLPSTGNGQASSEMLLLGFLLMGFGSVVLLLARRPVER